jgi:large subunit ribosomal protein L11
MIIKLLIEGGEMKPGPALSQKLGPLGMNINQIISKVNEATESFKGLKVPVELNVDPSTKTFEVEVFSPPVSELLKKEVGAQKGSGLQGKSQIGNISIEQVISVAKTKMPNLLCKTLKAGVKSVAGTCVSLGILVENKAASEIGTEIDEGIYDKEIKSESTVTSEEKKAKLKEYFNQVKAAQEAKLKVEAAAKEAEAAEAAAAVTVKPKEEATAAPAKAAPAKK